MTTEAAALATQIDMSATEARNLFGDRMFGFMQLSHLGHQPPQVLATVIRGQTRRNIVQTSSLGGFLFLAPKVDFPNEDQWEWILVHPQSNLSMLHAIQLKLFLVLYYHIFRVYWRNNAPVDFMDSGKRYQCHLHGDVPVTIQVP